MEYLMSKIDEAVEELTEARNVKRLFFGSSANRDKFLKGTKKLGVRFGARGATEYCGKDCITVDFDKMDGAKARVVMAMAKDIGLVKMKDAMTDKEVSTEDVSDPIDRAIEQLGEASLFEATKDPWEMADELLAKGKGHMMMKLLAERHKKFADALEKAGRQNAGYHRAGAGATMSVDLLKGVRHDLKALKEFSSNFLEEIDEVIRRSKDREIDEVIRRSKDRQ
jgi:hypothetical protein